MFVHCEKFYSIKSDILTSTIFSQHYNDVIMGTIASQITSLTIVYSIVYSDADHKKHQSSASLAFARRIHRGPVNSPHKWPVMRKMFPFDDVIMKYALVNQQTCLWLLRILNTSHYLNLSIYSPTYISCMNVPHKWTQIWCIALPN